MGIFQRLSTLIKSNVNDLISRSEDPEKMLNQIILDMRDQLAKAKREVASAIADERKLKSQLDAEYKQVRDWQHRAELAVRKGRDDMARQALVRQQEHAERLQMLEQTWKAQAAETENLKNSLRALNEKIEEAKRKRNLLIAKQKRAQAQKRIHQTMSGLSNTSAFEAFNRMADKIEEDERQALAQAEVTEAIAGDTLETEFLRLESGRDEAGMEDRLLALKSKMGLLPPSEADAPKQLGTGTDTTGTGAGQVIVMGPGDETDAGQSGAGGEPAGGEAKPPDQERVSEAELISEFERLDDER